MREEKELVLFDVGEEEEELVSGVPWTKRWAHKMTWGAAFWKSRRERNPWVKTWNEGAAVRKQWPYLWLGETACESQTFEGQKRPPQSSTLHNALHYTSVSVVVSAAVPELNGILEKQKARCCSRISHKSESITLTVWQRYSAVKIENKSRPAFQNKWYWWQ